jgi:hypothetical protein
MLEEGFGVWGVEFEGQSQQVGEGLGGKRLRQAIPHHPPPNLKSLPLPLPSADPRHNFIAPLGHPLHPANNALPNPPQHIQNHEDGMFRGRQHSNQFVLGEGQGGLVGRAGQVAEQGVSQRLVGVLF